MLTHLFQVPIVSPSHNVTLRNITCSCGNGIVPIIWNTALSVPGSLLHHTFVPCLAHLNISIFVGFAGNISNVLVDGARFYGSSMAVAIKSLPSFGGFVNNVTWRNIELYDVRYLASRSVSVWSRWDLSGGTGHHDQ
jgi:hypothetical protein